MRQALAGLMVGSILAAFGAVGSVRAAPLTSYTAAGFQSAFPSYTYESFVGTAVDPGAGNFSPYDASQTIGNITYDTLDDIQGPGGAAGNGLLGSFAVGNGVYPFGALAFGVSTADDWLVLEFGTAVQNYATGIFTTGQAPVQVVLFDSSQNQLGSYTLPTTADSGNPTFFGVSDSSGPEISMIFFEPQGDEVFLAGGPPFAADAAVPEPATVLLLGAGLIGLAAVRRKLV